MKTVGLKLKCSCHGLERIIVKNHPRLGLLCQQGADGLKDEQPKEKNWRKICWDWYSKWNRLSYADKDGMEQCFTCHVILHWTQMQCGHGIPRQHEGTPPPKITQATLKHIGAGVVMKKEKKSGEIIGVHEGKYRIALYKDGEIITAAWNEFIITASAPKRNMAEPVALQTIVKEIRPTK